MYVYVYVCLQGLLRVPATLYSVMHIAKLARELASLLSSKTFMCPLSQRSHLPLFCGKHDNSALGIAAAILQAYLLGVPLVAEFVPWNANV